MTANPPQSPSFDGADDPASCKRCRYGEQKENVWCRAPGMEEAGQDDLQGIHHTFAEECDDYSPNAVRSTTPGGEA